MSQDDATRYQLPADENRAIFASGIVPDLLTGPMPQDPATAVFLPGQPGAGKTRVAQLVAEQLDARGGFADFDSDLYKPYHPQYAQFMAEDDRLMTVYTGLDGRAWMRQAQQFVRGEGPLSGGQKLNALVQEIAMDPEFPWQQPCGSTRPWAPATRFSSWPSRRPRASRVSSTATWNRSATAGRDG